MAKQSGNSKLHRAKSSKSDEFYTQLSDIEKELKYYKAQFKGKTVYCNCDDPYESWFFKYFALNFNHLGLKKLIATCYAGSSVANTQLSLFETEPVEQKTTRVPHKIVVTELPDLNEDGTADLADVEKLLAIHPHALERLKGDGDFRSPECVELLKEADIVCTNPPFSLFREYVAQLMEYDKKFLIIGNQNAVTYKEIFPLIKENKMWFGHSIHNGDREFKVPETYEVSKNYRYDEEGNKYVRVRGPRWFTNLDHPQRHEEIILFRKYTPEEYPHYDNYNAIEVAKTADIPCDFDGVMGVPITFLDKYNPEQFEIVWQASGNTRASAPSSILRELSYSQHPEDRGGCTVINNKRTYGRILIRRKSCV